MASNNKTKTDQIVVVPPDGGWAWVVMIASFMCCAVVGGIIFNVGFLFSSLEREFNVSLNYLRVFGALFISCHLIAGPFASALTNRFGFRLVTICGAIISAVFFGISCFATSIWFIYITYCTLSGIGISMIYIPSITVIGFYFEKWRGLATGVALCGLGVGGFAFSFVLYYTLERFSWRINFVVQAAIVLLCVIFALAFRPIQLIAIPLEDEEESKTGYDSNVAPTHLAHTATLRKLLPDGRIGYSMLSSVQNTSTLNHYLRHQNRFSLFSEGIRRKRSAMLDITLFRSPSFLLLAISGFFFTIGMSATYYFLIDRAEEHGMELYAAVPLFRGVVAINTFATVICGALSSIPNVKPLWINNIAISVGGLATMLSSVVVTGVSQWTFAVFFGICIGCFKALRSLIAVEMFGLEKMTDAFGLLMFCEGLASAVTNIITDAVYEFTQSYDVVIYFGGVLMLLSAFLCYPLTYVANWERARRERSILRPV